MIWEKLFKVVPALGSVRNYSRDAFRCDLVAGITVATVAVPQAMAYASIVGLPAEYGLYTAIVMTAVGALFDSSKQLINGPTNAISIAVLSALGTITIADHQDRVEAAVLLALLVGLIQTGITLLRLGDLTRYISHAVIVGFTAGAAVLLMLDQIKNLLGLTAQGGLHDHFLKRLWLTWSQGGNVNHWTVTLSAVTIALVIGSRWLNRRRNWRIPELLLAVVVSALIVWVGGLSDRVAVIGQIPRTLPGFSPPTGPWSLVQELADSALAIAVLGLLEAIAMAKTIASRTGQKLDINQQCLSEGLANVAGSFFHCYPGSGSLTRSAINHHAGAATQWSGVISAAAVAVTVLLFAPAARYIPRAALAGILIVTAFRMVDWPKLVYHLRATRFDAVITLATAISAVAISVEYCIMVGTFLSFLFYVPRAARLQMTELVLTPDRLIRERRPSDPVCSRWRLFNFEGELFFGAGPELERYLSEIESLIAEGVRVVLVRLKYARNLDAVCLELMERFVDHMRGHGVAVLFCGISADTLQVFHNVGLDARLGPGRIFPEAIAVWSSTKDAVQYAYQVIDDDLCDTCPKKQTDSNLSHAAYYEF
jgi:SulP family sulfate permease